MLTQKAVAEFCLSRSGLKPKSQRWYRVMLARFTVAYPHLPEQPQTIHAWLATIKGPPETVDAHYRALCALYQQTCLWHPKVKNPMPGVRRPRVTPKAMRTFIDEELYSLFSSPLSPRDRALMTLLLDAGPRAEECASLTWDNVMPDHLIVVGKCGERVIPISPTTYRLLQGLRTGARAGPVFVGKRGPLTYEGVYRAVRRCCLRAGISGRRSSPHTFRHTFGTLYAGNPSCNPNELQKIMGHSDFKTTLKYIHSAKRSMIDNHRICTPLKGLEALAQGRLFAEQAVEEAESILKETR